MSRLNVCFLLILRHGNILFTVGAFLSQYKSNLGFSHLTRQILKRPSIHLLLIGYLVALSG